MSNLIEKEEFPRSWEELKDYVIAEGPRQCYFGKPISADCMAGVRLILRPAYLIVDVDAWGEEELPEGSPEGVVAQQFLVVRLRRALPPFALPGVMETEMIPAQVTKLKDCSDVELEYLHEFWVKRAEKERRRIKAPIDAQTSRIVKPAHGRGPGVH